MNIGLVWPKSTFLSRSDIWPPLGLWYISSRLKSLGYETEFFDLNFDAMPEDRFDYLFVGGTSPQIKEVRHIAEITKDWKAKRVLGGAGAWASPESHKNLGYDLVVGGEADDPNNMKLILNNIENHPTYSNYLLLPISKTLDWVLPPDRSWVNNYYSYMDDPLDGERIRLATMYNTRGCIMRCAFCEVGREGVIFGKRVRYEPIDAIEEQIKELAYYGFNGLAYYDDVADFDKKKTYQKIELHKRYKMKYRCFMRSDFTLKHGGREYLKELRDGGLFEIFVGIESADNNIKQAINKDTTIEMDEAVLAWCRELGIRFKGSFIMGLPSESMASMQTTRNWILKQNPNGIRIQVGRLIPFTGTPLGDHPERYDIQYERKPDDDWFYSGDTGVDNRSFVSTSHLSVDEIDTFWRQLLIDMQKMGINQ